MDFDDQFKEYTNKKPKSTVHYTDQGKERYKCKYCKHFSGGSKCNAVIGDISPEGLCSLYEEGRNNPSAPERYKYKSQQELANNPKNSQSPALKKGIHSDPIIAQTPV